MTRKLTRPTSNRSADHPPSRFVREAQARQRLEPKYNAIHFLDGWTGTAYYLGQLILCGPRTTEDHKRHATEEEAIACIKGEWQPDRPALSVAERNRRRAETPPLDPATGSGPTTRPVDVPGRLARQRGLRATPSPVIPGRRGHPATCKHKWCYCYNAEHRLEGGPCRRCVTDAFNKENAH